RTRRQPRGRIGVHRVSESSRPRKLPIAGRSLNDARVHSGWTFGYADCCVMDAAQDRVKDSVVAPNARDLARFARPETTREAAAPIDAVPARGNERRVPAALAIVIGMTAAEILRQGAFYSKDAFGVAVVSGGLIAVELAAGVDRRARKATLAISACAFWWWGAALVHGP